MIDCVEAYGIVHEDTLFDLKVIPRTMHDRFCNLRKHSRKFETANGSIIPYWLGYRNEEDDQELPHILKVIQSEQQKAQVVANTNKATDKKEVPLEEDDDQWDKEDIDQILGKLTINEITGRVVEYTISLVMYFRGTFDERR